MPKSVNKVILLGNVGKDPEVKFLPSGSAVANFSLATSERFKDKGGEWQDRTEWHNLTAYQRLAHSSDVFFLRRQRAAKTDHRHGEGEKTEQR